MSRILWRSWTPEWGAWEIIRLQAIGLDWYDGYVERPRHDDIWLTNNGRDHVPKFPGLQASYFAECDHYISGEYSIFPTDTKWDIRFTFNPDRLKYPKTYLVSLPGYWAIDGKLPFDTTRDRMFGMVLTCKHKIIDDTDNGQIRQDFVSALGNKSFVYWGRGWQASDSNWQGECRNLFDWHFETRSLLSRCKFGLALDTSKVNGFLTEKFWNALAAGTVPVYSGPSGIKDVVPAEAFIYVEDFDNIHDVIRYCESMTHSEWLDRTHVGREFFVQDRKHSWENLFRGIDRALRGGVSASVTVY